jgi:hypothetical protein
MKKIAQKESFVAEEADVEKYIQELAVQNGQKYEVLKKMYDSEERKDSIKMELIQKKAFDFIEHNANIKIVEKADAEVK